MIEPAPVASIIAVGGGQAAEVVFEGLTGFELLPLGSPQAVPPRVDRWLRASLTNPMTKRPGFEAIEVTGLTAQIELSADSAGIAPDHVVVNGAPADLSRPFQAFGPNPQYGDTLMIGSEEALAGARPIHPARPRRLAASRSTWSWRRATQ